MGGWRNKYGNRRINSEGKSFASKLEKSLHDYLLLLEKAGEVSEIICQPNIHLTDARILMIPDFRVIHTDLQNEIVYYEAKGFETDVWRIKRRLWKHYGPARLRVFKGNARGVFLSEEITPGG